MIKFEGSKLQWTGTSAELSESFDSADPLADWQREGQGIVVDYKPGVTKTSNKDFIALSLNGQPKPFKMLLMAAVLLFYKGNRQQAGQALVNGGFDLENLKGCTFARSKRKASLTKSATGVVTPTAQPVY